MKKLGLLTSDLQLDINPLVIITCRLYLESLKNCTSGQTQAVTDAVLAAERKIILKNFIESQTLHR